MNKKQIAGLVIAAVLFVLVSGTGMVMEKQSEKILSSLQESIEDEIVLPEEAFVGVVQITGTIMNVGSSTMFQEVEYDHNKTIRYIEQLAESKDNKGMVLYIDSPGGLTYDIDELYEALKYYKDTTHRPVIAYMASSACSGGYYVGMVADEIYANRNSMVGNIGCIISLYDYSELLQKLGVKEVNITSGKNKAMGSGGVEMTDEQRQIYQSFVDEAYDYFLEIVAQGRSMDKEQVRSLADGRIYTAKQALEANLIDKVGTYDACLSEISNKFGDNIKIYYEEDDVKFSDFFSQLKGMVPKSESQVLTELMEKSRNGGLMYYADLS